MYLIKKRIYDPSRWGQELVTPSLENQSGCHLNMSHRFKKDYPKLSWESPSSLLEDVLKDDPSIAGVVFYEGKNSLVKEGWYMSGCEAIHEIKKPPFFRVFWRSEVNHTNTQGFKSPWGEKIGGIYPPKNVCPLEWTEIKKNLSPCGSTLRVLNCLDLRPDPSQGGRYDTIKDQRGNPKVFWRRSPAKSRGVNFKYLTELFSVRTRWFKSQGMKSPIRINEPESASLTLEFEE
jgi:hypothetical protein